MNVTVNEVDQHQVTLHIELPAAEAKKGAAAAVKNLANKVNIPGFRKGKAPRMILESYLGKDAVKEEINDVLINKAYNDALNEKDITPVSDPEVKIISEEKGQDFVFEITVTKKPEVKLGEYKGIQAAKEEAEVTDEQVAAQMQQAEPLVIETPEAAAEGSIRVYDYDGCCIYAYYGKIRINNDGKDGKDIDVEAIGYLEGYQEHKEESGARE
mgnify:CR=1 FL=1